MMTPELARALGAHLDAEGLAVQHNQECGGYTVGRYVRNAIRGGREFEALYFVESLVKLAERLGIRVDQPV